MLKKKGHLAILPSIISKVSSKIKRVLLLEDKKRAAVIELQP